MDRGRDLRSVPLALRLPNPPPAFTGRQIETTALQERLRRGPLVAISGPAGCGKTALALHTLFELGADCVERSLWFPFSLERGDWEPAFHAALRALAGTRDTTELDTQQCVDLADKVAAVVVIDHFDAAGPAAASWQRLLAAAVRYARRSRWIVTSRAPLELAIRDGQSLELGPMPEAELIALAHHWAVGIEARDAAAIAKDARGSPFWLRQQLTMRASAASGLDSSFLSELPIAARTIVQQLSWLELSVPRCLFGTFDAASNVWPEIERRGLLDRSDAERARLHPVVRTALRVIAPRDEILGDLLGQLGRSSDANARFEAVRLLLEEGRHDAAARQLDLRLDGILAAGLASRLWTVLAPVANRRFDVAKLAVAAELGAGSALEWAVRQSPPASPQARLHWLSAMAYSGRLVAAAAGAKELSLRPEAGEVAFDAAFLGVRCLVTLGQDREAIEQAEAALALLSRSEGAELSGRFASRRPLLDVWTARAHVLAAQPDAALAIVDRLEGAGDDESSRREIALQRAIVLSSLGRARSAYELFDREGHSSGGFLEHRGLQRA